MTKEITAQKMKFFIKDFFSKFDKIQSFLRIWSHLLKKSLMENFIFWAEFVLEMWCFFISTSLRFTRLKDTMTRNLEMHQQRLEPVLQRY